jgi:hypothetical protein
MRVLSDCSGQYHPFFFFLYTFLFTRLFINNVQLKRSEIFKLELLKIFKKFYQCSKNNVYGTETDRDNGVIVPLKTYCEFLESFTSLFLQNNLEHSCVHAFCVAYTSRRF